MHIHFIAIGGSAMHNLAIALKQKGYEITGSDDEIFEPSRSRLQKNGILPARIGWFEDNIHSGLDAVVLGMHARADNPELQKAKELGLRIFSYPEYIFEQTRDKRRVVIGGSHGKTSITSMILHVMERSGSDYDYMVGAQLEGFNCMVKLSENAPVAILEGDEYLSSPIDRRPKFLLYRPHVSVISGIAWDHVNVFPTFEIYLDQFRNFIKAIEPNGTLIYCETDPEVKKLVEERARPDLTLLPYQEHPHTIEEGKTFLNTPFGKVETGIFGSHNLQNINAARLVCRQCGLSDQQFYNHIGSFSGASKRLEKVAGTASWVFYKDFAHSPSKLKATTQALKRQYPERQLVACMELHTFSSLSKEFLPQYDKAMEAADRAIVYFNPEVLAHKKLPPLAAAEVKAAFGTANVEVITNTQQLRTELAGIEWRGKNLLMMSSGNFDGIDFQELGRQLQPAD